MLLPPEGFGYVDAIRFAARAPDGRRSGMYRFWRGKKGDLYLSARVLGGAFKTSFHADGWCQTGFNREWHVHNVDRLPVSRRRVQERWRRPPPIASGVWLLAQVILPESEMRSYVTPKDNEVRWLPDPGPGHALEVSLLLQEPRPSSPNDWPTRRSMRTQLIGVTPVPENGVAWLLFRHIPVDEGLRELMDMGRARVAALVKRSGAEPTHDVRGIVLGRKHEDGRRWWMDLATTLAPPVAAPSG